MRIVSDNLNNTHKQPEEISVTTVIERFQILFDFWQFKQIHYSFRRFEYFLFDARSIHIENTRQNTISD